MKKMFRLKFQLMYLMSLISLVSFLNADVLTDIKPGEWYEVPNSKLDALAPTPLPDGSWTGFKAEMESWSGAGYDTKRDRLVVWGGGHHDYSGNEIYGFDINKLAWSKLSPSSTDFTGDEKTGEYPDGKPRARHTYGYIQYVPAIDGFCTLGGQGMFPSGQVGTNQTHCFDFNSSKWVKKSVGAQGSIGGLSGVDPATGKVWMHSTGSGAKLLEWNPTADVWIPHAAYTKGWFPYYYSSAIGAGKFVVVGPDGNGKSQVMVWNLSNPDAPAMITDLPSDVSLKSSPGFVFDTKRNLFVAWSGGADVYVLNPATMSWNKISLASTNKVTPTAAEASGTFGRFRYIPSKDLFIGVNHTADNVFLFRMPAIIVLDIKKSSGSINHTTSTLICDAQGRLLELSTQSSFKVSPEKYFNLEW